jgi:hypothetical protein
VGSLSELRSSVGYKSVGAKAPKKPVESLGKGKTTKIADFSHLDQVKGFGRRLANSGYSRLSSPRRPKSEKVSHKF